MCPFCKGAYSEEAMRSAIPCNACHTLSAWGQSKCAQCQQWIVVKCLFCDNLSPHNQSACLTCGEAFQGMSERKAARDAEVSRQQTLQTVSAFAPAGASFLGAIAGAVIGGEISGSHHHHHREEESETIESGGGLLDAVGSMFDGS
jgi:hypothetical protein